ncbi:ABC transporter ATP-binding protein [Plantactinospora sp. DSM 117369]
MTNPGIHSLLQDRSAARRRIRPGTLRRIVRYAGPYRRDLLILLLLVSLDATAVVLDPLLLKLIIDRGILPRDVGVVVGLAALVAVVALVNGVVNLAQHWYSARIGQGVVCDLRIQVFEHLQRMSVAFYTHNHTGTLLSRLGADVNGAQRALTTTLSSVVSSVISMAAVLATMAYLSWQLTLVIAILLPTFIYLPARIVGRRMQHVTRRQMQADATLGGFMAERFNVAGAVLSKLYGRRADDAGRFAANARDLRDAGVVVFMYGRIFAVTLTVLAAVTTALVYGFGGYQVIDGGIQLGALVALAALLTRLYRPLVGLSNVHVDVMTALVSFDRVFEVLDLAPHVAERPDAVTLAGANGRVEYRNVVFAYPGSAEGDLSASTARPPAEVPNPVVVRDVSFCAEPGQMVALVGPSGAGKSSLLQLLPRLYDVTSGTVRIDGHDVRDLTLASLSAAIGVVTQDSHLFHDTIRANLEYARPDVTDAEMHAALEAAQLADFMRHLPDGLDTVVGDRGYRLSGGEQQRLALARLLVKAPPIVVLDEATAHLDSESEVAVQRALQHVLAGRTCLVIAHRLSTVRNADQILVLDRGRVVEQGRHDELLRHGGLYAQLCAVQFDGATQPADITGRYIVDHAKR